MGKERKRLPLSFTERRVRQRTGGNDVLPLVNRLSIKLIDQNDIRFPSIKDESMTVAEENSFECPFVFEFALLWKRLQSTQVTREQYLEHVIEVFQSMRYFH